MQARAERKGRRWSLTLRLTMALSASAVFVALLLGFLGAERADRDRATQRARAEQEFCIALAERSAPLLERGDLMRLSVLATVARDQTRSRILVLDRSGRVKLDTALIMGDRQLGLLAHGSTFQRTTARPDEPVLRETLTPIRFGGELIGELRMQCSAEDEPTTFDFVLFGLVLLGSLTLVAVAAIMGYHWSTRVKTATDALLRLSAGEVAGPPGDDAEGELQDLSMALREMERGVQDGMQLVVDGYAAMALQVVDGLERRRLVPPGHAERTARYAARLAERVQLLPSDRQELDLACRLIDLGKSWVRPAILQKQGPLDESELDSLRSHPVRAAEHLGCMPGLRRVARTIRHQNERYDGGGHPDGLRGDRIPIGSRIVAIASAFDLLTTCAEDRPLEWEEALEQLTQERGSVFDPWLLELFAEEIGKAPPATDRPVMIVPGTTMPWKSMEGGAAHDDDLDAEGDAAAPDLEVLFDENRPEERP